MTWIDFENLIHDMMGTLLIGSSFPIGACFCRPESSSLLEGVGS